MKTHTIYYHKVSFIIISSSMYINFYGTKQTVGYKFLTILLQNACT